MYRFQNLLTRLLWGGGGGVEEDKQWPENSESDEAQMKFLLINFTHYMKL